MYHHTIVSVNAFMLETKMPLNHNLCEVYMHHRNSVSTQRSAHVNQATLLRYASHSLLIWSRGPLQRATAHICARPSSQLAIYSILSPPLSHHLMSTGVHVTPVRLRACCSTSCGELKSHQCVCLCVCVCVCVCVGLDFVKLMHV